MRRDYRDLFVVHTEPDAPYVQKWKSRIQSIAEIITPERAIEEFEKSGRASLFDFYEHLMPSEPGYGFDKYPG
jgi:chromo domain-containing protein 1